jgi:hypothetical protein
LASILITIEYNMNDCSTANAISLAQSETNHAGIVNAIQAAER